MGKKILVNYDFNRNQILNAVIQVLAAAPGSPVAGLVYYDSNLQTFRGYNGTIWLDLGNMTGATNLSFSRDGTTVTVISSTGSNAILPQATTALAGVMSAADKTKLDGIETGANNYSHPDHTGDVTSTGDGATTIANGAVTFAKIQNIAANRLLGRLTTSGVVQELTAAQVRAFLNVVDGANNYTHPNHSGDVTSVGDGATTIVNGAVTNAKMANMNANTIKGRISSSGAPQDLTAAQVRTIINVADGADVTNSTNVAAAGATMNADISLSGNAYFLNENNMASNSATKVASQASIVAYVNSQIADAITGGFTFKGDYNAATNTPNLDVTPIAGIKQGDVYVVTANGDFFTEGLQVGDMIIAKQDSPTTLNHWARVNKNIPDIVDSSESVKGIIQLATQSEVNTGTNAVKAVTPLTLQTKLNALSFGTVNKFTQTIGNGSATSIAVTHGLGSQFVIASVYEVSTSEEVECEIILTSSTQTTFRFNVAPTTNQYRVVIAG